MADGTPRIGNPVPGIFTYVVNDGRKPVARNNERGRIDYMNVTLEERELPVHDARHNQAAFSLERNGFQLIRHTSDVADFRDKNELNSVYQAEMEAFIKSVTGAARVHVFAHTLRTGDEKSDDASWMRETVNHVHNDYTEQSGPQRVRDLYPDEAEDLLQHRFAVIQVWRAIRNPIASDPLGICDARSLAEQDLVISERRYPNRVGQTYQIAYNPDHDWYYFPQMTRDEAMVFKVYDSATDGRARFTAHSAFADPTSPPDAAPRESIEMRTMAFF